PPASSGFHRHPYPGSSFGYHSIRAQFPDIFSPIWFYQRRSEYRQTRFFHLPPSQLRRRTPLLVSAAPFFSCHFLLAKVYGLIAYWSIQCSEKRTDVKVKFACLIGRFPIDYVTPFEPEGADRRKPPESPSP